MEPAPSGAGSFLGEGRFSVKRFQRRYGAAIASLLLSAFASPVSAGGDELEIRLEAKRKEVRQGMPLNVTAEITNNSSSSRLVKITFEVGAGDLPAVPFHRYVGSVGPRGTASTDMTVVPAQWFAGRGRFRVQTRSDEVPQAVLNFKVLKPAVRLPRFEEVSSAMGATTVHRGDKFACENHAAGAAWGDIEGDGDLDLFLPQQEGSSQLYLREGGGFKEDAAARGVAAPGVVATGAVFADYDNDGDPDLYVVAYETDRLFRNEGNGTFTDVTTSSGITETNPGSSAAWGDYDRDGFLDLYLANWGKEDQPEQCRTLTYSPDSLYHNQGNGTFTDVTHLLEATGTTTGAGFQATWFDYDLDGDDDLYLGNDFLGQAPKPNVLWRNDGSDGAGGWRFTNVSVESGAGLAINTMGLAPGDYDRDGDLDLGLSNIFATNLLRNEGNGSFSEVGAAAGMSRPHQRVDYQSVTWGMGFFDFNNDGWEDLFVAAGAIRWRGEEPQPDELFAGVGEGRFADLSVPSGIADPDYGRGVAFADYDRDGRMDMYVVNRLGTPRLYHNVTRAKNAHWLQVDLTGVRSNRDGCGALVTVRIPMEPRMVRELFCGSVSLASGGEPIVHFGLGDQRRVKRLTIRWPSGAVQVLKNVRGDRRLTVEEPA